MGDSNENMAEFNGDPVASGAVGAKAADIAKARDAGWTERSAFNYDSFTSADTSSADWHGAAKIYEWKDEYGEFGPAVPELESNLFHGDLIMRKGEHINNLELEVTIEGPVKVGPVRNVSTDVLTIE